MRTLTDWPVSVFVTDPLPPTTFHHVSVEYTETGKLWPATFRVRFVATAPGQQRNALVRRMSELAQAYSPMTFQVYSVANVFLHPWVKGYYASAFGFSWKYLDVDRSRRIAAR